MMPDYIVFEDKFRDLSEFEMLTPKGKAELALKRYPGLKIGPFASLNTGVGVAMLAEEERIRKLKRTDELIDLAGTLDPQKIRSLKKLMYDVRMKSLSGK
jgi:hypothetical protein|uniref:hypothetical protein n=2 Tax=Cephaloticoccus sp. TaxID=1985742 RepID=UPI00404A4D7D